VPRASTMLLYGDSGTGKTSQIGEIAKWVYARTGRITRLISADSGWDPLMDLIITPTNPTGIIEAWNIAYVTSPLPVLIKLSEGYWPSIEDGPGGLGLVLKTPTFKGRNILAADGREVGMYANEGLSTWSDLIIMSHIRKQTKIGQDVVGSFSDVVMVEKAGKTREETISFAKAAPSHFGQVQDFMLLDLVPRFSALAVDYVMWTGHEAKGDDEVSGIKGSILGPATCGKAAVGRTARKFGDTFHMTTVSVPVPATMANGKPTFRVEYRAYYEPHADDVLTRMQWPAKISLSLNRVEEIHKKFPGGYIPLGVSAGLDQWLDFVHPTPVQTAEVSK